MTSSGTVEFTRTDGPPLHAQVERYLRGLIIAPEYQHGELLPVETSIATTLGVSRNTVRVAMAQLIQEGLIVRKAGVGTRVVRRQLRSDLWAWHSFSKELLDMGIVVQTFNLEAKYIAATKDVAGRLHLVRGARVLRLDRLRGWEEEPVVFFRSYLHPRLCLNPALDFSGPLYTVIEKQSGITADHAREELSSILPNSHLATSLGISTTSPLLYRQRVVYDVDHRPMEYSELFYRSDRFTLTLDTRRMG